MYISSAVLAPPLPPGWAPARPRLILSHSTRRPDRQPDTKLRSSRCFWKACYLSYLTARVSLGGRRIRSRPFCLFCRWLSMWMSPLPTSLKVKEHKRSFNSDWVENTRRAALRKPSVNLRWVHSGFTQDTLWKHWECLDVPAEERSWKGSSEINTKRVSIT